MFPQYLQKGSYGPGVQLLLAFLLGQGFGRKLVLDCDYGDVAIKNMKIYQGGKDLSADGGFGPETRKYTMNWGFDFEDAVRRMNAGPTLFVQPDGSGLLFDPQTGESTEVSPDLIQQTREQLGAPALMAAAAELPIPAA